MLVAGGIGVMNVVRAMIRGAMVAQSHAKTRRRGRYPLERHGQRQHKNNQQADEP